MEQDKTAKMISMKEYIEFVKVNPEFRKDTEKRIHEDIRKNEEMSDIIRKELRKLAGDRINLLNKLTLLRN